GQCDHSGRHARLLAGGDGAHRCAGCVRREPDPHTCRAPGQVTGAPSTEPPSERQHIMITFESLTKEYGGRRAVDDVSLTIGPGKVTGFLGPNGAGKSTTMRMLLGLDHPSSGRALIDGRPYARLVRPCAQSARFSSRAPAIRANRHAAIFS